MKQAFITPIVIFLLIISLGIYYYQAPISSEKPTEEGTESVVTTASKYDGVDVKTIELRENEGRSLLSVAYPVTTNLAINQELENFSQEFIKAFNQEARDQEEAYKKYLEETGIESHTIVTDYTQHFDVSFANDSYISFIFDRYKNTGGTGSNTTLTKLYNHQTGEVLPLAQLFNTSDYLNTLSELSRAILYKRAEEMAKTLDGSPQALAEFIESRKKAIHEGTKPLPENFDSLSINDEDSTLVIYFDKYQVGPGSDGIVRVAIPLQDIASLFVPEVRDIFSISEPASPPREPLAPEQTSSVDCDENKCVALTFDDGPSVYTKQLLDTLEQYQVPATFFVLGRSAKIQPNTIVRIVKDGHELGNHTWDHKDLRSLSEEAIDEQLQKTDDLLYQTIGVRPRYLRPPYGAINDTVRSHIDVPVILWTVDPEDWKKPPHDELIRRMTQPVQKGYIILAHDIHQPTVAAVPEVISELRKQGFTFVTISDLLEPPLQAGKAYRHR